SGRGVRRRGTRWRHNLRHPGPDQQRGGRTKRIRFIPRSSEGSAGGRQCETRGGHQVDHQVAGLPPGAEHEAGSAVGYAVLRSLRQGCSRSWHLVEQGTGRLLMAYQHPHSIIGRLWNPSVADAESQIYAILDAARDPAIYPAVVKSDLEYCSLYRGEAAE